MEEKCYFIMGSAHAVVSWNGEPYHRKQFCWVE